MRQKKCIKCKLLLPLTEYVNCVREYRSKNRHVEIPQPSNRIYICRKCIKLTPECKLKQIYYGICYRSEPRWGKVELSFEEFKAFMEANNFSAMYARYAAEGYKQELSPSVDRIDNARGYERDNIRLVTHLDNCHKSVLPIAVYEKKLHNMHFLKRLRLARGLSRYAMAQKLGVLPQTYEYYEKTAKGCRLDLLCTLRRKLELSWQELGELIDGDTHSRKKPKQP